MNIPGEISSERSRVRLKAAAWLGRVKVLAGIMFVVAGGWAWAADGAVTILAPKPNEIVKGDVTVTWNQEKAGRADHVHVFIDRGGMKPVKTGTSIVLKGLTKGTHEITVQAYSSEHEPLDAKASVTVKVE